MTGVFIPRLIFYATVTTQLSEVSVYPNIEPDTVSVAVSAATHAAALPVSVTLNTPSVISWEPAAGEMLATPAVDVSAIANVTGPLYQEQT